MKLSVDNIEEDGKRWKVRIRGLFRLEGDGADLGRETQDHTVTGSKFNSSYMEFLC